MVVDDCKIFDKGELTELDRMLCTYLKKHTSDFTLCLNISDKGRKDLLSCFVYKDICGNRVSDRIPVKCYEGINTLKPIVDIIVDSLKPSNYVDYLEI